MPASTRLVPAAVAAWLAAGIGIGFPATLGWLAAVLAAAAVAALAVRRSWAPLVAIALAAAALVTATAAARAPSREPVELRVAAEEHRTIRLEVTVTGRLEDGRVAGTALGAPVLVFLDGPDGAEHAVLGAVVAVEAGLSPTEPGEDVAFLAFAEGPLEPIADAPGVLATAEHLRSAFRAAAAGLPDPGGGLLPGLAIGDTTRVPPELDDAMIASSLSHLTAVSGANCAIVVGVVIGALGLAGAPRGLRVAGAAAALAGFVVLVTPEPSVLRASVMAGVALVGLGIGRPAAGLPLLCVAVVGVLALDPWLSRTFGFALSVLATAGLLVLAGPIARTLARVVPSWLATVLAIPLAAQLACQPVLLLLDPSLPVYGVPANLLAAPAAPAATVLGLIACLAAPIAPWLATAVSAIAWLPATWIAAVARLFADLPGARGPWPEGLLGIALLVVLESVVVLALLPGAPPRLRRLAAGGAAAALLAYSLGLGGIRLVQLAGRPDWQVAMCDVGQGDATLLRSGGRIALVDLGAEPALMRSCLDDLGIQRVDLVVLTHFDLDHVGGAAAVLGRVDTVLTGPTGESAHARLLDAFAAGGARVVPVSVGDEGRLGAWRWRVLWPPPRGAEPGNEASVVLAVEPAAPCRCLSAVLLGDLGETAQLRMLGTAAPPAVDVVKVSHHGSADQASALYARLAAVAGLIGVGADNGYGHPTDRLLGLLDASGTTALRTDEHGLILLAPGVEPGEIEVWTER